MRKPKNQMLGTMVPPLMQLSVNQVTNERWWKKKKKKKNMFYLIGLNIH